MKAPFLPDMGARPDLVLVLAEPESRVAVPVRVAPVSRRLAAVMQAEPQQLVPRAVTNGDSKYRFPARRPMNCSRC